MTSTKTVFEPGDRVPDFILPDVLSKPVGLYLSAIGNPIVLVFCSGEAELLLEPFVERANDFAEVTVLFVTPRSPIENKALAEQLRLPFAVLSDTVGQVSEAYRFAGRHTGEAPALTTYTLDPNQRVAGSTVAPNRPNKLRIPSAASSSCCLARTPYRPPAGANSAHSQRPRRSLLPGADRGLGA